MKNKYTILLVCLCLATTNIMGQTKREKTLHSTDEQFQQFTQFPNDQPLLMANFVKFKTKVAETGETGRQVYERYIKKAMTFSDKLGAEVIWYGKPLYNLVAPADEVLWDAMFIIKYPNKMKFFEMMQTPGFPTDLRAMALEDSRLVACSPQDNFFK